VLQAYPDTSDVEAVELTVVAARWQVVFDRMNAESPLVSLARTACCSSPQTVEVQAPSEMQPVR
jgi:hypothetical protein